MRSRTLSLVVLLSVMFAGTAPAAAANQPTPADSVSATEIRRHLTALQSIADTAGSTRVPGTAGFDAAVSYVESQLTSFGYQVERQPFGRPDYAFPPTVTRVGQQPYDAGLDYFVALFSPAGEVTGEVQAVDLVIPPGPAPDSSTSGCEPADFAGFVPGRVALVQRGLCNFRTKALNAQAAGATAVIAFNEGQPGRTGPFLGSVSSPGVSIPVIVTSYDMGSGLANGGTVRLSTPELLAVLPTTNLMAQTSGDPNDVLVVGARLSAAGGPGMNDNATGAAALLELARVFAGRQPDRVIRFAWWGLHSDYGGQGAAHYAFTLPPPAVQLLAGYVDVQSIGSPNHILGVLNGAMPLRSALVHGFLRQQRFPVIVGLPADSDAASFATLGVPVGGLFSGTTGRKTLSQALLFGGRPFHPYDSCNRKACDLLGRVDVGVVMHNARALAHAVGVTGRI